MWKLIFTNHITCAKHKPTASNKEKKYINHNLSWGFPQKKKKKIHIEEARLKDNIKKIIKKILININNKINRQL